MGRKVDVLVVGGGQAGLVCGRFLKAAGLTFEIHERSLRIGTTWRNRYDSLVLFTSRRYSALPDLTLAGDPDGYPTKDELADYLEWYAAAFALPVALGSGIVSLSRQGHMFQALTTRGDRISAPAVIVATGAFQNPVLPPFARHLAPDIVQLTAESYRRPAQLPPGRVAVIGDGATGRQIAAELTQTHAVFLAVGKKRHFAPQRILGQDCIGLLARLGLLQADKDSAVGRALRARDPIPRKDLDDRHIRRHGVRIMPRAVDAETTRILFGDGRAESVDTIIWTLGYRDDTSWLAVEGALDGTGGIIENRGVSPVPGLYFVGRSWQRSRGSALLAGVATDARDIVRRAGEHVACAATARAAA